MKYDFPNTPGPWEQRNEWWLIVSAHVEFTDSTESIIGGFPILANGRTGEWVAAESTAFPRGDWEPATHKSEHDLPCGDDFWRRDEGDWKIVTGELSHNCNDAFAGWRGNELVTGL